MIKLLGVCFALAFTPAQCDRGIPIKESCKVIREILYSDGSFSFTAEERKALRRVNKDKLVALKDYYLNHCPQ